MEDHEFDRKISSKLDDIRDFEYDEAEWEKVSMRLPSTSAFSFLWLAIALLILSLLGSNAWMGYRWHDLNKKYKQLEVQNTSTLVTDTIKKTVLTDTIYKHMVIHQYDTIHHTIVYHHVPAPENSQDHLPEQSSSNNYREEIGKLTKKEGGDEVQSLHSAEMHHALVTDSVQFKEEEIKDDRLNQVQEDLISVQATIGENSMVIDSISEEAITKKDVQTEEKDKKEKTPMMFNIGVSGNLPFLIYPSITGSGGIGGGLQAEISLMPRLSAFISAHYNFLQYSTDQYNEDLGIPDINKTSSYQNDVLVEVNSQQQVWQYGTGLKYVFANPSRIQPYVALGYLQEKVAKQQLDYNYRDISNDKLYLVSVSDAVQPTFRHILDTEAGGIYALSPRMLLQAGAYFNRTLKQQSIIRPDQFGLRTVIYYKLKK